MEWSKKWQLFFNTLKCSVLHSGKDNDKNEYYTDIDHKNKLEITHQEKDVGVIFTENMKFDEHINNAVKKANQMTGLIKRSFEYIDKKMFLKLYKAIVRPHLEYANVVWHPIYIRQKQLIEGVQRRATKIVPGLSKLSYDDRLIALNLPTLKYRQTRGDLIQTFKIIHGLDNVDCNTFFKFCNSSTRNSELKLYKEFAKSKLRSNFLPNRIHETWNSLPANVKTASDVLQFKKKTY